MPATLTLLAATGRATPWHGALALNPPPSPGFSFLQLLAAAAAIGMLRLAQGLYQGKRRAADAAVAVLLLVAVVRIARDLGDGATVTAVGLALLLFATRPAFDRGCDSRPPVMVGTVALASLAAAYLIAMAMSLASDRFETVSAALSAALAGRPEAHSLVRDAALGLGLDALALVVLTCGAVFIHRLLRPVPAADGHTAEEHGRAAAIVAEHGTDSLDPFALREDKAFHFAHGGVLAYRTLRETAVVSGDPIGPPGTAPAILDSFRRFALERGWDVVLTAGSERHLGAYRADGMRTLHIGNEAVVDPQSFSLEGRAIRKVRQSVHRIRRHGWTIEVVEDHRLSAAAIEEIDALEIAWRTSRPRLQGFAMTLGRLWGAGDDVAGIYVTARDRDGRLGAFLRFVEYDDGLSLDVMRRLGAEPNGLNEAMVVAALEHARERGLRQVSLNFAGFAHVMAADAALSRGQRLLRAALSRAHGRFQLERLVRFNEKFQPAWRPRYLVYGRRTHLPLAALRVLQAEAYIRPPRSRPLTARWSAPARPVTPLTAARP